MIKKAEKNDVNEVANLAVLMWDSHSVDDLIQEFYKIMSNGKAVFFLKYENGMPIGFAQCQLRYDYVEGTETTPVGYLEGIFIKEGYRHNGYAKELLTPVSYTHLDVYKRQAITQRRQKSVHDFALS